RREVQVGVDFRVTLFTVVVVERYSHAGQPIVIILEQFTERSQRGETNQSFVYVVVLGREGNNPVGSHVGSRVDTELVDHSLSHDQGADCIHTTSERTVAVGNAVQRVSQEGLGVVQ